jgi:hypothetical protein
LQNFPCTCIGWLQLGHDLNWADPQKGQAREQAGRRLPHCWQSPFDILRSISFSREKSFF